jgi:hypothetical protein
MVFWFRGIDVHRNEGWVSSLTFRNIGIEGLRIENSFVNRTDRSPDTASNQERHTGKHGANGFRKHAYCARQPRKSSSKKSILAKWWLIRLARKYVNATCQCLPARQIDDDGNQPRTAIAERLCDRDAGRCSVIWS